MAQCELACDEEVTALAAWPTNTTPFAHSGAIHSSFHLPASQSYNAFTGHSKVHLCVTLAHLLPD